MNSEGPKDGSFQQQVLRKFTALWLLRQQWSGQLILTCGLGEDGAALALAANIAGAVCLSIEPDGDLLKTAQRNGACDFAVNTLDEALRTMKNEIRKGRALSVGLLGGAAAVLEEVLERGLLPVLAADLSLKPSNAVAAAMQRLRSMGARIADFGGGNTRSGSLEVMELVDDWAQTQGSRLYCIAAADQSDLTALDEKLKGMSSPGSLSLRWLERSSQHFRRERPLCRAIWLNEAECNALRASGREL